MVLTAMSFMSLFGVAGYVNSRKNKPVIKVDNIVVYQDEILVQLDREIQMTKSFFGESFQIDDSTRIAILQELVTKELDSAVVKKTSENLNMYISDDLVRKIIFSQAEFMDAQGNFDRDRMRRFLAMSGWTEGKYIEALKRGITKQHLVQGGVDYINVPKIMLDNLATIENQKKIFKYLTVNYKNLPVKRKISKEELEQYYNDFSANFTSPEARDITYLNVTMQDVENSIVPTEEEIKEYISANTTDFEKPEMRNVLQMLFENEEQAKQAAAELKSGKDFYTVASKLANQSKEDTSLGETSKDMLIADIAGDVFDAKAGEVIGPIKSELGWHILQVTGIKPAAKTDEKLAKMRAIEALKNDKSYDAVYNFSKMVEDRIGMGETLEQIAKDLDLKLVTRKALTEEGVSDVVLVETAFSYNVGEISQVVETSDGFMVVRVDNIIDPKLQPIEAARGEIERLWAESERMSMAQDIINDVVHDLENGDKIDEVAGRFNLNLSVTQPLKRSETFGNLPKNTMLELFRNELGTPKVISKDGTTMIVVATRVIQANEALSEAELDGIKAAIKADLTNDYVTTIVDSFAKDYDVRIKYRLLGMEN